MNRRKFLKLIGIGGAAALAPTTIFAKLPVESLPDDVWHPRFGVWTVQSHIRGMMFQCVCDCGKQEAVHADKLLSPEALSCDHVRCRVIFSLSPDAIYCQNCGKRRRFFFSGSGLRIWRCGYCEDEDIRNFLRRMRLTT